jgi:transposase
VGRRGAAPRTGQHSIMLHSINNMRVVAELCRSGQPIPDPLAGWLAESLQAYLDNRCNSLTEAFGLRSPRGGIPWRMEEAIRKRDAALRELAKQHFADLSRAAQVSRIYRISSQYAASAWLSDCKAASLPESYRGSAKEHLWHAFKSGAAMPLCPRRLRAILVE